MGERRPGTAARTRAVAQGDRRAPPLQRSHASADITQMTHEGTGSGSDPGSVSVEPTFASLGDPAPLDLPALAFQAGPSPPYVVPTRRYVGLILVLLAVVIVGAVAALTLHGPKLAQTSSQTLNAATFTTSYPSGWLMSVRRANGITTYQLSSGADPASAVEIPPPGTISITISEVSAATVALHPLGGAVPDVDAATQTALELLPNVVGTPPGALADTVTAAAHATTLGGSDAAQTAFAYTYAGLANAQSDIVARRGDQIFDAELDSEPSLQSQGNAALATLIAAWRWRG
jgi:hypothetical protein